MSVDATKATWKLGKTITAIQKLLLLSLADRAGEDGECWPSLKRIMSDTNLDRHTVVDNRKILVEKGFIQMTGEMKGRTKLIPVMRLTYIDRREGTFNPIDEESFNSAESNTVVKLNSAESSTVKQCGNTHTEPNNIEPIIKHNNNCAREAAVAPPHASVTVILHSVIKQKLQKIGKDSEELISQVRYYVDSCKNKRKDIYSINIAMKIIKEGKWEIPFGYKIESIASENKKFIADNRYQEYVGRLKSDIELGILSKNTIIMKYDEWKECNDSEKKQCG